MATIVSKYNLLRKLLLNGGADFDLYPVKVALVSSGYTFNAADTGWAANIATWSASSTRAVGARTRPTTPNGHWYEATASTGVTGSTEPTFPTNGTSVVDGGVTWLDKGLNPAANEITGPGYTAGGVVLASVSVAYDASYGYVTAAAPVWSTATMTFRRAIAYFSGTIDGVENPLIAAYLLNDAPADISVYTSDYTLQWSASGVLRVI